jgi:hypothetical protein
MRDDVLIAVKDAPPLFPTGWSPTAPTLYRWAQVGVRGHVLRSTMIGGRRFLTIAFIREFIEACGRSGDGPGKSSPVGSPSGTSGPQRDGSRQKIGSEKELVV